MPTDWDTAGAIVDSAKQSDPREVPTPPLPSAFDLCQPRADVAARRMADDDFVTDLAPVIGSRLNLGVAILSEFQRVRGLLQAPARIVARLWQQRLATATSAHLHRMGRCRKPTLPSVGDAPRTSAFGQAIAADVASGGSESRSRVENVDAEHYRGLPLYAAGVGRSVPCQCHIPRVVNAEACHAVDGCAEVSARHRPACEAWPRGEAPESANERHVPAGAPVGALAERRRPAPED